MIQPVTVLKKILSIPLSFNDEVKVYQGMSVFYIRLKINSIQPYSSCIEISKFLYSSGSGSELGLCCVCQVTSVSHVRLCDPMVGNPPGSCPWGFFRQGYWSSCHALLQGIFPTQRSNHSLLH